MILHVECSTAPRDHFGKPLSALEVADRLIWSESLTAGQVSEPLPPGVGLILTLTPAVDAWVAIGATPDPTQAPRRCLRAGLSRTFEANGGLRIAWTSAVPASPPVSRRKATPAATEPPA